jgi:hypothetical protein
MVDKLPIIEAWVGYNCLCSADQLRDGSVTHLVSALTRLLGINTNNKQFTNDPIPTPFDIKAHSVYKSVSIMHNGAIALLIYRKPYAIRFTGTKPCSPPGLRRRLSV